MHTHNVHDAEDVCGKVLAAMFDVHVSIHDNQCLHTSLNFPVPALRTRLWGGVGFSLKS